MSRSEFDPGLVRPDLISEWQAKQPTAIQRQAQEAQLADQQSLADQRAATTLNLRQEMQQRATKYNEQRAVGQMLALKQQNQQEPTTEDFMNMAPMTGGDLAKDYFTTKAQQHSQAVNTFELQQKQLAKVQADHDAVVLAQQELRKLPIAQRMQEVPKVVAKLRQEGRFADDGQATAALDPQHWTDSELDLDINTNKAAIDRQIAEHNTLVENNLKISQGKAADAKAQADAADAALKAKQEQELGKPKPGIDVPFPVDVQTQKIAEKSVPEAPMSDARFRQQLQLEREKAAAAGNTIPPLQFLSETSGNGASYIDASKVEPKTLNALQTAAGQANIPVVDKDTASGLRDAATVKAQQQQMLDLLEGRLADNPVSRLFVAPENKLKQLGQIDPNLAVTGTFVGPAIQALRAMAGSKNFRITQSEINAAIDNFVPKATDTVDVAKKKVSTIDGFLASKEKVALGNKGGAGTSEIPTNPATGKPYAVGDSVTVKGVKHKITAIQDGKPVVQ